MWGSFTGLLDYCEVKEIKTDNIPRSPMNMAYHGKSKSVYSFCFVWKNDSMQDVYKTIGDLWHFVLRHFVPMVHPGSLYWPDKIIQFADKRNTPGFLSYSDRLSLMDMI
jgi:hypothetical protein